MELMKVIKERRSVREYRDAPIERSTIERLVIAATLAPSARNLQPWAFAALLDRKHKGNSNVSTNSETPQKGSKTQACNSTSQTEQGNGRQDANSKEEPSWEPSRQRTFDPTKKLCAGHGIPR